MWSPGRMQNLVFACASSVKQDTLVKGGLRHMHDVTERGKSGEERLAEGGGERWGSQRWWGQWVQ